MIALRVLPRPGRTVLTTAHGRSYPVTAATVDIPWSDAPAIGSDQATPLLPVGTTSDRPAAGHGQPPVMYDVTIGATIFAVPGSYPTTWIDIAGAPV